MVARNEISRNEIYWADLGEPAGRRPVCVLTRSAALQVLTTVTVAPITRTIRGIASEIELGTSEGLPEPCVINCDTLASIPQSRLDPIRVGVLDLSKRAALDRRSVTPWTSWCSTVAEPTYPGRPHKAPKKIRASGVTRCQNQRLVSMTEHVQADELRVTVEMGDDFQPSDQLTAALSDLAAALSEGDDEVSGFGFEPIRSFTYTSVLGAQPIGTVLFPKLDNWDNTKHIKMT